LRVREDLSVVDTAARLDSLDAFRGFVMICLASGGFGISATANAFPESHIWQSLRFQFQHVPWVGCAFWDLIQPSFMFMVGMSMPFSYSRKSHARTPFLSLLSQAVFRSLLLILLGLFLSTGPKDSMTNFSFMNVLSQIGLGYTFVFLLWRRSFRIQIGTLVAIFLGYWAWFALTPVVSPEVDGTLLGLPRDWPILKGFTAHWQKNANAASVFDQWFLNQFPRTEIFRWNEGGYQTLNFIPSIATMLLGLMTGEFIRGSQNHRKNTLSLAAAGIVLLGCGWALNHYGYCPLVKRIWTPSWTLFSAGAALLIFAFIYTTVDGLGWKTWSWPLKIAGMNSMALYILSQRLTGWTADLLQSHFGQNLFAAAGEDFIPLVRSNLVLLCFWGFAWWLYRQRIFFRI